MVISRCNDLQREDVLINMPSGQSKAHAPAAHVKHGGRLQFVVYLRLDYLKSFVGAGRAVSARAETLTVPPLTDAWDEASVLWAGRDKRTTFLLYSCFVGWCYMRFVFA
jgi:hypothetical protein